jgi:hypothetical protein
LTKAALQGSPVYILYKDNSCSKRETLGWLIIEWGGWVYIHRDKPVEYPGQSSGSGRGLLLRSESIIEKRILIKGELIETGNTLSSCMS